MNRNSSNIKNSVANLEIYRKGKFRERLWKLKGYKPTQKLDQLHREYVKLKTFIMILKRKLVYHIHCSHNQLLLSQISECTKLCTEAESKLNDELQFTSFIHFLAEQKYMKEKKGSKIDVFHFDKK